MLSSILVEQVRNGGVALRERASSSLTAIFDAAADEPPSIIPAPSWGRFGCVSRPITRRVRADGRRRFEARIEGRFRVVLSRLADGTRERRRASA